MVEEGREEFHLQQDQQAPWKGRSLLFPQSVNLTKRRAFLSPCLVVNLSASDPHQSYLCTALGNHERSALDLISES